MFLLACWYIQALVQVMYSKTVRFYKSINTRSRIKQTIYFSICNIENRVTQLNTSNHAHTIVNSICTSYLNKNSKINNLYEHNTLFNHYNYATSMWSHQQYYITMPFMTGICLHIRSYPSLIGNLFFFKEERSKLANAPVTNGVQFHPRIILFLNIFLMILNDTVFLLLSILELEILIK